MTADWSPLAARIAAASGPDPAIDRDIAAAFGVPAAPYTTSAGDCRALVAKVLPHWRLHVGFNGSGVIPYAIIRDDEHRAEADAPTVPLAILRAMMNLASRS